MNVVQVPPSVSFQSLSARPPDYDPGLAVLTLRVSFRGTASSRGQPRPAVRVVHGTPDLYGAVERAANALVSQSSSKDGDAKTTAECRRGVDSGVFWTLDLPEAVIEPDTRSQVGQA